MKNELKYLLDVFIYKNRELKIDTFRKSIAYVYNIFLIPSFIVYALIFYITGETKFAFIKLIIGLCFLVILVFSKKIKKPNLYPILLCFTFVVYSTIAFLNSAEYGYGFMWSFFVVPMVIFLLDYKNGLKFLTIYIFFTILVGIYDISTYKMQFTDYLSFSIFISSLLLFILIFVIFDYSLIRINDGLIRISEIDYLTSLYNRRKIDTTLKEKINVEDELSIGILDIDDFKAINDQNGHQIGDSVLSLFAETLKQNVRKTDIVGRWGGEEFIIIFPNTTLEEAYNCLEKMRLVIKNTKFINQISLTCSFGLSSSKTSQNLDKLIQKADNSLYEAKKDGKDRIIIAS